jgi:succinate-semialdehyde dehydrogenase / glutarate-semialdehyde dehydrogenase
MKMIETVSPLNGKILNNYPYHSDAEILKRIQLMVKQQNVWRTSSITDRIQVLHSLGRILQREKKSLAELMHSEMGKSLTEGEAEIEKCAGCADFYATNGEKFLLPISVATEAKQSYVAFEPLGIILTIMPWNFPFWQALRASIPAIFAGNAILLKHASNVSGCALAIENIWNEALGGSKVFSTLLTNGETALRLIELPEVSAVSFTGSTQVGKKIAAKAGENLKKCVLELGGSDPFIVLDDANLSLAAKVAAKSRLINAGQSCISAKRFIVHSKVKKEFENLFCQELKSANIAPLARSDLREDLHKLVKTSLDMGAKLLLGGEIPSGSGFYYPPTILCEVNESMPVFREETFGPVAAIIEANNTEEAIRMANASNFGLGAALFTQNLSLGKQLAEKELQAGSCFLNEFVRSDPRLPFGGIKESGYGRELSDFGIREFVNIKTVFIS